MQIKNKSEFQRLSLEMKLGNRFRVWYSPEAVQESGYQGYVYIRGPVRGWPHMVPWVLVQDLPKQVRKIKRAGGWVSGITFIEVPVPGLPRRINAEACQSPHYMWVTWGEAANLSLRHDLEQNGRFVKGLRAVMLLRQRVPAEDRDMLQAIWDRHPGCIIEFTTYSKAVGVLQRQTIIWEARHY